MSRDWTWLPWIDLTWGERAQKALAMVIASVIALAMFFGGLLVLGGVMDGVTRLNTEHDRCLKNATNGYEIRQCR